MKDVDWWIIESYALHFTYIGWVLIGLQSGSKQTPSTSWDVRCQKWHEFFAIRYFHLFFFISFHLSILLDFSDIHWKLIEHFVWLRDWIYYVVLLLCSNLTCWCSTQRIEWLTLFWKKKFLFFLQKSWELLTLSHAVNFSTFLVFIRNKIWNLRWTRWDRDYRSSLEFSTHAAANSNSSFHQIWWIFSKIFNNSFYIA